MKKLIIAVTIALAAVVGQAATITWNSKSAKLADAKGTVLTELTSGSIWLIVLSDDTGWSAGTWSATSGSVTELASASIGGGKNAGKIGSTYTWEYEASPATSKVQENSVLAVVFKDSSGAYDQLEYVTTGTAVTDTMKVTGLASLGDTWIQEFNFGQAGGNITTPVPEPTSTMFVLLGVAGLALKRKRA